MEEKWINDRVDFSQNVKRLIKAVLESGDSNFNIPLSRIGVEDIYEGKESFKCIRSVNINAFFGKKKTTLLIIF